MLTIYTGNNCTTEYMNIVELKNSFYNKKALDFSKAFCGPDGTRTRDLRRDRAAF